MNVINSGAYEFAETLASHLAKQGFPFPGGAVGLLDSCLILDGQDGRISKFANKWWGGGERVPSSFTDMVFNGWFVECEALWMDGTVPKCLNTYSRAVTLGDVKDVMYRKSRCEKNPDDHGTVEWFKRELAAFVGKWLVRQEAEKKAKDKRKGLLAKTRLVRLRLDDIEYILNRIDACVEPDGEPGFRSRVRACLLGSREAALEGLEEDK